MRIGSTSFGYRTPDYSRPEPGKRGADQPAGDAGKSPRERDESARILQGEWLGQSRQTDYRHIGQGGDGPQHSGARSTAPTGAASAATGGTHAPEQRAVAAYRQVQQETLGLEVRRIDVLV